MRFDLHLHLATDLKVFEVPDPVEDILFSLLFEDILVQDLILGLQSLHALRVAKECLLQVVVLLLELGD